MPKKIRENDWVATQPDRNRPYHKVLAVGTIGDFEPIPKNEELQDNITEEYAGIPAVLTICGKVIPISKIKASGKKAHTLSVCKKCLDKLGLYY